MRRYSTPTIDVVLEGQDVTDQRVDVTIQQRNRRLTFEDVATTLVDGDTVASIPLTQAQTGGLSEGVAEVQVDILDGVGHRVVTTIGTVEVERTLRAEVVDE